VTYLTRHSQLNTCALSHLVCGGAFEQQHQPPCHAQPRAVKRGRDHDCDTAAHLQALQAESHTLRAQKHGTLLLLRKYVCMFRVLKSACEADKSEASFMFPQLAYVCRQANLGPDDLAQGSAMADATPLNPPAADTRQQLPSISATSRGAGAYAWWPATAAAADVDERAQAPGGPAHRQVYAGAVVVRLQARWAWGACLRLHRQVNLDDVRRVRSWCASPLPRQRATASGGADGGVRRTRGAMQWPRCSHGTGSSSDANGCQGKACTP
jgi:hypothetical protein